MFEKNTKEVNRIIARMFAGCAVAILAIAACSYLGVFEFGERYTLIVLVAGLVITVSPIVLIRFCSDTFMKYYMLIVLAVFIGVLGTNNRIGIYMTYALVPIFSCLYFDPKFTVRTSVIAYIAMIAALYVNSATKYEVIYEGRDRMHIFIAYALGFTVEYIIVNVMLRFIVRRARQMMVDRNSAEEENRMKSRFLSSMSHEIRTPMNAIIGMADVALRDEMSEDVRKCVTIIKSSSTGLLEIINDILDLSKIEAGKLNIIEDTYTTKSLIDDMKSIIDARNIDGRVPIYYHIQEDMPPVLVGDVVRIRQVMLNFASNAIKYTDSGRIDVTVGCENLPDGRATLTYAVQDTGQGIKQEDVDRLFEMYSQFNVEENHGKEGTGIGLAISKYFIDEMGGTVDASSEWGVGSRFAFALPQKVITDPHVTETLTSDMVDAAMFRTHDAKVLLVDDNELNREVVKAILEPMQLTIDEAANGLEAVHMANTTPYDMIFMDSHMPVMNGETATRSIREMKDCVNRNTPIIAITADAIAGVREHLMSVGMNDYIVKPIDVEVICGIIRKYLPEEKVEL